MAQILGNQPQPQQPRLDWSQAQDFNCSHCGGEYFINAVMIKKFSKIVTGTTKDAVIPVDILMCGNCGKPVEELIPAEIRKASQTKQDSQTPPPESQQSSLTLDL